jgi:hypothetical protein
MIISSCVYRGLVPPRDRVCSVAGGGCRHACRFWLTLSNNLAFHLASNVSEVKNAEERWRSASDQGRCRLLSTFPHRQSDRSLMQTTQQHTITMSSFGQQPMFQARPLGLSVSKARVTGTGLPTVSGTGEDITQWIKQPAILEALYDSCVPRPVSMTARDGERLSKDMVPISSFCKVERSASDIVLSTSTR